LTDTVLTDEEIDARCAELDAIDPYEPVERCDARVTEEPDDGLLSIPEDAARVHRQPPGPHLGWLLERLSLADVSDYGLVEVIAGWERLASYVLARQSEAIAELADRPCM
jgi:hypothetical protein